MVISAFFSARFTFPRCSACKHQLARGGFSRIISLMCFCSTKKKILVVYSYGNDWARRRKCKFINKLICSINVMTNNLNALFILGSSCNETTLHIVYNIIIIVLLIIILILIILLRRLQNGSGKFTNYIYRRNWRINYYNVLFIIR